MASARSNHDTYNASVTFSGSVATQYWSSKITVRDHATSQQVLSRNYIPPFMPTFPPVITDTLSLPGGQYDFTITMGSSFVTGTSSRAGGTVSMSVTPSLAGCSWLQPPGRA